ncbi:NADH-quinone oxidoreductase subunit NuoG [Neisseriaceae bacterium CLB008]|nr:NADH-quinone oxidoreductase subunit G [Neisseriaceae bacterium]
MLQIEIDGKELTVEQGSTVIEAANKAGTYIPHFCYHKKLSIAANCRMCLVEVEKAPKPLPACATPVTDGMKVMTHSPLAKKAQQGVMEFLLINHPLDCPICDQGGECQLQDLAVGYGNSSSRYQEEKRAVVGKDMGPLVSAQEMSRCIHCTRCVRFTEEIAGMQEIGMVNRGEHSEIMSFVGQAVETELSGNVIDLCPVGALTSKPFRYDARSWELSRRKSISAHDALGSNLVVQVKDHGVRRVIPMENEAINECWLSDRDRFAYEGLSHAERLQRPMIKHGGEWFDVEWETALEYVAKGLNGVGNDFGKDSIGILANPMNTVEEHFLTKQLAAAFGVKNLDSRLLQQDFRLDAVNDSTQWLGQSIEAFAASNAFLVVGAQLRAEQPLLTARIRQAAKKGAKVSVLASSKETLHMDLVRQDAIHPNDWVSTLEAMASGSDAVATSLKDAEHSTIVLGAIAQNHPRYADIYAAAQALAEATGSVLSILPQAANTVGASLMGVKPAQGGLNTQEMIAKPNKAVVLVNVEANMDVANGAALVNALGQAQTVIALSAYKDAAMLEYADVLLPVTPFTETAGSFVNMEGKVQSFHGVVRPLGEARPMWKVLRVMGNVLNLPGFDYESVDQIHAAALSGLNLETALNNHIAGVRVAADAQRAPTELTRVGYVAAYATDAIVRRAPALQQTAQAAAPLAYVHSNTLSQLGFAAGDSVLAEQKGSGAVMVTLAADDALPEAVVCLAHHQTTQALGALVGAIELKRG